LSSDDESDGKSAASVPIPPYIDLEPHLAALGAVIVANGSDNLKAAWQTVMEGTLRMCASARQHARQTKIFEHFPSQTEHVHIISYTHTTFSTFGGIVLCFLADNYSKLKFSFKLKFCGHC
jgi:hypothetical protein